MSSKPDPQSAGQCGVSRRSFLRRSAAAAAGAVAFPTIIPASAYGGQGNVAPSNRLVMGCIGLGAQGTGNMKGFLEKKDFQIVAVCDVDKAHRERAAGIVNGAYGNADCGLHNDFREVLERDDLDVVSLALPDHWHSIPAITAANKKLEIYAEKPLALTISEGRAMVNAVEKNNVIWQTGSWQRSKENFRRGAELVRNGYIGEVHTVQVGLPTGKAIPPQPEMPIPAGFDYDFWLGPAPWAPYTKERCHWNFRWILDYSGGQLTDWAAHHVDIANWGMGTEATGPVSIEATGQFPKDGLWDAAIHYFIKAEYPAGVSPVAPNGFTMLISDIFPMGTRFEGSEGWVFTDRGDTLEADPTTLLAAELKSTDTHLIHSDDHALNFAEGVRTRTQCVAPIGPAHHAIALAHLGNIAMRLKRKVDWDPVAERFVNDREADSYLARAMRGNWHLPTVG